LLGLLWVGVGIGIGIGIGIELGWLDNRSDTDTDTDTDDQALSLWGAASLDIVGYEAGVRCVPASVQRHSGRSPARCVTLHRIKQVKMEERLMSEPLSWRDDWVLEIEMLDDEHREMVRLINRLFDAADRAPLTGRLDALMDHLRRHFATEERFMRAIEFPDTDKHCREHVMQMAEFVDLRRSITRSCATALDAEDQASIRHWFFNHVVAEDRRFGAFYRDVVCGDEDANTGSATDQE
jgi:hemerythrin